MPAPDKAVASKPVTSFDVPLRFSSRAAADRFVTDQDEREEKRGVHYDIFPAYAAAGKSDAVTQRRLKDHVVFKPQVTWLDFRREAVIDWLELRVQLAAPTQGRHLHRWATRGGISSVYFRPILPDESGGDSSVSDSFLLKLQDPTRARLNELFAILEAHDRGVTGEVQLNAMEVSVDFYPRRDEERDLRRDQMVSLLQHHYFPVYLPSESSTADARQIYGDVGGSCQRPRFLFPASAHSPRRRFPDSALDQESTRKRLMRPSEESRWPATLMLDSTLYFGPADGPAMIRIMNKITNKRVGRSATDLEPPDQRARVEVTLNRDGLEAMGLRSLGDLDGFRFKTLRKSYFTFALPCVRKPGLAASIERFEGQGCYGVEWRQRAIGWNWRATAREDDEADSKLGYFAGSGPWGSLVAWKEMHAALDKTLAKLKW